MSIEDQLRYEARKAKPDANIRFENNGHILKIFWSWQYKGHELDFPWSAETKDFINDPEYVGAVIDFSLIQMKVLENGLDDAIINNI